MAAAFRAVDLDARDAVTPIDVRGNRVSDRGPEAGPAGAALELRVGSEERLPAGGAVEGAGPLLVVERARPGPLGAVLAQHVELFQRQRLLPFFFGFHRPRSLSTRYIFCHEDTKPLFRRSASPIAESPGNSRRSAPPSTPPASR